MTEKNKENKELEKKIEKLPFEELMERLEQVADELSQSNISLDKMIALYQEGELLKKHCQKKLDEAKLKVEIVNE